MRGLNIPLFLLLPVFSLILETIHCQETYYESFDEASNWAGGSAGSYTPKTYTHSGPPESDQFSSNDAVRESTNTITGYAWRLKNDGTPYLTYEIGESVSSFSVQLAHWNLDNPMTVTLEYSLNSGGSYTFLQAFNETWWIDQNLDDKAYGLYQSGILNLIPDPNQTIMLKISSDGNERLLIDDFQLTYNNSSSGLEDPTLFQAMAVSENQIDVVFAPNSSSDDLVIVFNESGLFVDPIQPLPAVGQPFAGGTLFYTGAVSPQAHTGLSPGQTVFYKAWSYDGTSFSDGLTSLATTPDNGALPNAWINEIHYDNDGGDVGEFLEVVIKEPDNINLDLLTVSLYNGSNGEVYASETLNNLPAGITLEAYTIYTWSLSGIQNGAPEGMSLDYNGVLIPGQFLSYEGSFVAADGPATGVESTDIGVEEPGTTPAGMSLQLQGVGIQYSHFQWSGPLEESPGDVNVSQEIGGFTTWTGASNNDWHDDSNWTAGVPGSGMHAQIPFVDPGLVSTPVISALAYVNNLVVDANSQLEIDPSGALTVFGTFTNQGNVTIRSDESGTGSLIESNGIDAVAERYISPGQWHYLSAPITAPTSDIFQGLYLMEWIEPTETWNYIEELGIPLNAEMYGYASWAEGSSILQFDGTLNAGTQLRFLTHTPGSPDPDNDPSGYNLVGNPYPSSLDWDVEDGDGWIRSTTNTAMSVYYWNGYQYASYVKDGPNPGPNGGTNIIPPHQGFYVKCTSTEGGSIEVDNGARVHSNQEFYKSDAKDNQYIRLQVTGNFMTDETILNIEPNASLEFDPGYDALKLAGVAEAPEIHSASADSLRLSINSFANTHEVKSVQLFVKAGNETGVYDIRLTDQFGFDTIPIVFEDRENNVFLDLKAANTGYKFFANAEEAFSDFYIHFHNTEVPTNSTIAYEGDVIAQGMRKGIYFFSNQPIHGEVVVTDLLGRRLYQENLEGVRENQIDLQGFSGVCVFQIVTSKTKKVMKLYVP